jgi:hypothetical protein
MHASQHTRGRLLYIASAIIFFSGCTAAVLIFSTAAPEDDPDIVGYRLIGGREFPITLEHSFRAEQTLEAIGGTANVDAAELDHWIGSLWHGRHLAYALATSAIVLSVLFAWAARMTTEEASV